jgi:hypothetical protein
MILIVDSKIVAQEHGVIARYEEILRQNQSSRQGDGDGDPV